MIYSILLAGMEELQKNVSYIFVILAAGDHIDTEL